MNNRLSGRPFRRLLPPVSYLALVLGIQVLSGLGVLPPPGEMLEMLATSLRGASYWFIGACVFLENTIAFNVYFPGSVVVLMSMAQTHGDPGRALVTYAVIFFVASLAHTLNFIAGRILRSAANRELLSIRKHIMLGLAAYWHPHAASLASFHMGSTGYSYWRFLVIIATCWGAWSIFWGIVMYNIGALRPTGAGFVSLTYICLGVWFGYELWVIWRCGRNDTSSRARSE